MSKSWKDIKLRQAQELLDLGEFDDPLDLILNQMAIIKDTTIDEIEKLTPNEIVKFAEEFSFLNTIPTAKLHKTFKRNGVRLGLMDYNKLTLAQMVDIEEYYSANFHQNMHKILSCLYLEVKNYNFITGKYTLKDYEPSEKRENMFLELDMQFIWETMLFFYHTEQTFLLGMKDYLVQMKKEMNLMKAAVE